MRTPISAERTHRGSVRLNTLAPIGPVISHAAMPNPVSFRYFKTSPEIIQLAVMLFVSIPLSLRNIEDLLHERGVGVSYEPVWYWWHGFGFKFSCEIQLLNFTAKDRFRDRFSKRAPQ